MTALPIFYAIRTRTGDQTDWTTEGSGCTPLTYRSDPEILDAVARTVWGNAKAVLGLNPAGMDRPEIVVDTWNELGLTGRADGPDTLNVAALLEGSPAHA